MNLNHSDRAQVLVEALPYIQKYYKKTVVIKYGGNAMISEALRKAVISDIILLRLVGINVVVVHGGGPEINELLKKTGKESRFVNGLRYTDEETMEAVQMVLCGKVNKNLVATLNRAGGQAVGVQRMVRIPASPSSSTTSSSHPKEKSPSEGSIRHQANSPIRTVLMPDCFKSARS